MVVKFLIYFSLWLPITFFLLIFSFYNLTARPLFNTKINKTLKTTAAELSYLAQNLSTETTIPKDISPQIDIRLVVLTQFLTDYDSPLVEAVEILIKEADLWGLDYALIPAIAMQESGGCKRIPTDSYNCWGFGIYGDKVLKFTNYQQAIQQVAKSIKETYIKNGLTNPTLLEDRWAPQSKGQWSYSVNFFIGKIRQYESKFPAS